MRRISQISALILLYLFITAKSCDNQEQDDETRNQTRITLSRDSIKSTFESDSLSTSSLRAFEVTAKIKLSDFSDYLIILNDTSVAERFREKAREMIRELFISENSVLRCTNPDNLGKREIPIKYLLQSGKKAPAMFGKIIPDSIRVKKILQQTDDSISIGELSYSYIPAGQKFTKNLKPEIAGGTIDFLVVKHEKKFGKDTLKIWDVFLGNAE